MQQGHKLVLEGDARRGRSRRSGSLKMVIDEGREIFWVMGQTHNIRRRGSSIEIRHD